MFVGAERYIPPLRSNFSFMLDLLVDLIVGICNTEIFMFAFAPLFVLALYEFIKRLM